MTNLLDSEVRWSEVKWSEAKWSSWRTSLKWAKQTMKNESRTQSSMKVPNFAPHFWPSSIEIRLNFNYLMRWVSSCWVFHLYSTPNCEAKSEMMLHNVCNCEVTVVKARRLSQFIEQQSRSSDDSTAYILHQKQQHRLQPRCHPHISHVSCWWHCSALSKWNLTPSRAHL